MTLRRLALNLAVGIVLAALVILILFAYLSTLVKSEPERAVVEQEIPSRRLP